MLIEECSCKSHVQYFELRLIGQVRIGHRLSIDFSLIGGKAPPKDSVLTCAYV